MVDTFNITDNEDSVQVVEEGTGILITISDDSLTVTEPSDGISVDIIEDNVVVSDSDDSLTISDAFDIIKPEFQEVQQSVSISNTYNIDNSTFIGVANVSLGGHRVVVVFDSSIDYADKDNPSHTQIVSGITTSAVNIGEDVLVTISGDVEEVSWTWELNKPIFLGNNGLMTQTVPSTGFLLQIGYPVSATKMIVDIKMPISLG